MRNYAGSI